MQDHLTYRANRPKVTCSKAFKGLDIFGYPVQVQFDGKGSKHRTMCGSLFTVLFAAVVLSILAAKVVMLVRGDHELVATY